MTNNYIWELSYSYKWYLTVNTAAIELTFSLAKNGIHIFHQHWNKWFVSKIPRTVLPLNLVSENHSEIWMKCLKLSKLVTRKGVSGVQTLDQSKFCQLDIRRPRIPEKAETKLENIKSETIFVVSNEGVPAAIKKWGRLMQIFGNLGNTDCPCTVCSNKRPNNINSMAYNKYIGPFLNWFFSGNWFFGKSFPGHGS